jgi:ribonuclease J
VGRVSIFGGVSEIGGNKILVEDKDTRVLLDFGMSISTRSRYFSDPYVSPRRKESLLELGIIPKIPGIYSWEPERSLDAVILSHAHLDHYGYLSMLNREIPVHCGETTRVIMGAITDTRRRAMETDYAGIGYKTFRSGSKIKVGPISITPVHVDHSIPGAYGFILETSTGRMVYTGDLRAHGRAANLTGDFVKTAASERTDLLLNEATNMVGGIVSSEEEVSGKLRKVIDSSPGLVMASFSTMDTDRLLSFYNGSKASGRTLVLSLRQAFFLTKLSKERALKLPGLDDESIAVYKREKKRFEDWEEQVSSNARVVSASDLAKSQRRYVLAASLSDMEGMIGVRPEGGSVYVLSSSEPFNEEMELDMQRLIGWLDYYGVPLYHIHVSGHIMPQELRELVASINARKTVPIHTEHPELFAKFSGLGSDRVKVPKVAEPIEIG